MSSFATRPFWRYFSCNKTNQLGGFVFKTTMLSTLLLSSMAFAQAIPAGTYKLDASHSKIGFEIDHLVISTVEGKFGIADGTITIDKAVNKSTAEISIDAASIDTANKDRDDHLRSPDFFDVAKFPKVTFKSKSVVLKGKDLTLTGDLTMKNVTKAVILKGKYLGAVKGLYNDERIAFKASTKIDRKDFGLTWNKVIEAGPAVGEEVTIELIVEAVKEAAK